MAAPARARRLPRHYVASLPTRIFLCASIRSGRKRTKPASRSKWQPTKSSGYRRGTSRFGRCSTGSFSNGSEGRSTAARRSSQPTVRATPHGHSRTCAYCQRMSRRCRSRPVIALRPASASIGTSTIGVCLADSIRERRSGILPRALWRSQKQKARRVGLIRSLVLVALAARASARCARRRDAPAPAALRCSALPSAETPASPPRPLPPLLERKRHRETACAARSRSPEIVR